MAEEYEVEINTVDSQMQNNTITLRYVNSGACNERYNNTCFGHIERGCYYEMNKTTKANSSQFNIIMNYNEETPQPEKIWGLNATSTDADHDFKSFQGISQCYSPDIYPIATVCNKTV